MKEKEIRFSDIIKALQLNRKLILISVLVGLFLGFIQFLGSPNEYISTTTLLPVIEQSGKLPGGLGSLAGLAGIQLNENSGSTIPPNLYPDVVNSTPFGLYLIKQEFYFKELDQHILLEDYFVNYQERTLFEKIKRLPSGIIGLFKNGGKPKTSAVDTAEVRRDSRKLAPKENSALSQIRSRVSAEVDMAMGLVTVQVKMQNPEVAARLTELTYSYLSEYIMDYKASADKRNLLFIQERLDDAKLSYEEAQLNLANFRDRNFNLSSSSSQVRGEQLQNEVSIQFNVYNGLAQEVEQAKIRVQRASPVFNVLEPPYVPLKESSPKLVLNLVVFGFLAAALSICYVLIAKPVELDQ
ncbi:GumC domain-containing protein [Algoriphagus resistens]|uniref:hypothetical protein n=1 Tax=Algoriphagus resistens TaxID=1750590 RepID=UPI000716AE4E|nr:hypothetical protein [Algoriphagus resistens]